MAGNKVDKTESKKPKSKEEIEAEKKHLAEMQKIVAEAWEQKGVSKFLKSTIGIEKKEDGLHMRFKNGVELAWVSGEDGEGIYAKNEKFSVNDAKAVIDAARERGWEKINLHGTDEQKGMMWLEAQRQGIATDFKPDDNSPAAQAWKKEQEQKQEKDAAQHKKQSNFVNNMKAAGQKHTSSFVKDGQKNDQKKSGATPTHNKHHNRQNKVATLKR